MIRVIVLVVLSLTLFGCASREATYWGQVSVATKIITDDN